MKKIVEIEWDKPKNKNWLCDENIKYALKKCCPNTNFKVKEILFKPKTPKKKNKVNNKLKNSTSERKNFRISNSDYKELTDAYQKYKGIILKGAEFGPVRQAIKTILYSGRTKEDILNFMKWASKLCKEMVDDPDLERTMGWMSNWTMITVKRKMPEFLAGKFTEEEEIDPIIKKLDSLTENDFEK